MIRNLVVGALAMIALACLPAASNADQYVSGYTRSNGTYVAPHMRSSPDSSYNNNYGTSPNVNPYTGSTGTRAPTVNDQPPSYGYGSGMGNTLTQPRSAYGSRPYNPYGQ